MSSLPDPRKIRENILRCAAASGNGHVPSSFSVIEMLTAIYSTMRHDPENPKWEERDLFVLSKGHAALGYYCVLAEFGYLTVDNIMGIGTPGSNLGCHPDRLKVPGVEASSGSLGHGIGLAAGMALALKIKESARKVYVIVGDGEANEGSVWESIMIAVAQNLDNLTVLYDKNDSQTRCLQIPNPAERFSSFGCHVQEVNGHDIGAVQDALKVSSPQVKVVVCQTVKGYGCPSLSKDFHAWHRRSPSSEELESLIKELYA